MACFIAPATEAVIVSAVRHTHEKKEKELSSQTQEPSFSTYLMSKLQKLSALLWGGSFLLLIEHIWHGEIVPWFPFFTAFKNPDGILPMLYEIATVGTSMAFTVTMAWLIGVAVCYQRDKKHSFSSQEVKEG